MSSCISPEKPSRIPKHWIPKWLAVLTTALRAAFIPGESPPEVSTAMDFTALSFIEKKFVYKFTKTSSYFYMILSISSFFLEKMKIKNS
jgi:hypothetical protein